jgi:hypothetical protein
MYKKSLQDEYKKLPGGTSKNNSLTEKGPHGYKGVIRRNKDDSQFVRVHS